MAFYSSSAQYPDSGPCVGRTRLVGLRLIAPPTKMAVQTRGGDGLQSKPGMLPGGVGMAGGPTNPRLPFLGARVLPAPLGCYSAHL